jgi:glycosyltransferase involved in cell wall biosynthesis
MIAVGRYEPQKGFDLLLNAFASIAETHPDWNLAIVGEGPERPNLEAQVRRLRLEARVMLTGVVPDISKELANSQVMACSSRYEGFPNALAEGLAAGLPAVGYKGVSGVEDLIVDGRTGLLVDFNEGAAGLAHALSKLIGDPRRRAAASRAALEHIRQWAPDHIFSLWDEALAEATGRLRP